MPRIMVQVEKGKCAGAVMLMERISCNDLESDHFAAQLVERIDWAMLDAEDAEVDSTQARTGRAEAPAGVLAVAHPAKSAAAFLDAASATSR
jgi:hypothetical protein